MLSRTLVLVSLSLLFAVPASAAPKIGVLPSGSFDIFTIDAGGGGWVIHKIPIKGDLLWGCQDVKDVTRCNPVPLPDFMPGTSLEFIHIDNKTQAAWLKVTAPPFGDSLMACYEPESNQPRCSKVKLEAAPPVASLDRIWPAYAGDDAADSGGGGGGGLLGGLGGGAPAGPSNAARIEGASASNMWLTASIPVPGPVNLYACRGLASEPECQLAVPDVYQVLRADVGFKKISSVTNKKGRFVGVKVEEVVEGSAAFRAKIRPGMLIVKIGGFPLKNEAHFKGLLTQWPATYEIPVELKDGETVNIKVRRGGGGKRK